MEFWISETGYNWLYQNFKLIIVIGIVLLFLLACCCIASGTKED